jgi:hypothetical protein
VDLLPRYYTTQRIVALDVAQAKERSYCNRHPIDQFFPLAIEVFDCLHKHVNVFLNDYANAIWSFKGTKGPHLSTLVIFFRQKVSITLQRMQASSILNRVIAVGLPTSQLPHLPSPQPIYCKLSIFDM